MEKKLSKKRMIRILIRMVGKEVVGDMTEPKWKTKDVREVYKEALKSQANATINAIIKNRDKVV